MSNNYLYRFRSLRDESVGRIFTHNELYFASPAKFNDPFDCKVCFPHIKDFNTGETREDFMKGESGEEASIHINELIDRYTVRGRYYKFREDLQKKVEFAEQVIDKRNAELGMLCFSKPHDDILLWSHYANAHRGIALQFDEEGLRKWIVESNGWLESVDYTNRMKPTIKEFNKALRKKWGHLKLILLRKALHWKYEREYRAIIFPEKHERITYGYRKFPSGILKGVILGCQISDADRCSVEAWQKRYQPQIEIYRAVKDKSSFKLTFEPPIISG